MGLGDKFVGALAGGYLLADSHARRTRRPETMALVRPALGHRCSEQHGAARVPAGLRAVGLVSPRQSWQAVAGWSLPGFGSFYCLRHALDSAQLSNFRQVHL